MRKKTHNENRLALCAFCFHKGNQNLSIGQKEFIVHNIFKDFNKYEEYFPGSSCGTCRAKLAKIKKGGQQFQPKNYEGLLAEQLSLPPKTRLNMDCDCSLCKESRTNVKTNPNVSKQPGAGRPAPAPAPVRPTCQFCYSDIHPGVSHQCSRTERVENLKEKLTPVTKQILASEIIKEQQQQQNDTVQLRTRGRPMTVSTGAISKIQPVPQLSLDTFKQIQTEVNLSDRKLNNAAKIIRQNHGRKSVESGLRDTLRKDVDMMKPFFKLEFQCYTSKENTDKGLVIKKKMIPTVVCKKVEDLVDFVKEARHISMPTVNKVGFDGGQGFLKICLNIVKKECLPCSPSIGSSPINAVSLGAKSRFLDSGVKKLFILAIAPSVTENYENVQTLLQCLNLQTLDFSLATDLKLCNIVMGLQSYSSKHPCTFCEGESPWKGKAKLRTFGRIRKLSSDYSSAGCPLRRAAEFMNCIHPPLIDADDSELVLNIIPPPELHLMLGISNKLFDELNAAWGDNNAYKWGARYNIFRVDYRGGSLLGNQCDKLLKLTKQLKIDVPPQFQKFVTALSDFNDVKTACFGKLLDFDFNSKIIKFEQSYRATGLAVTPKAHIVFEHVPHFCNIKGVGLGFFSEQASEAVHHDFGMVWERYKVNSIEHPTYAPQLLKTTLKYNSDHV